VKLALNSLNSLSPLVLSIGEPVFPRHLLSLLNTLVPVDLISAFIVKRPGELEHLFSASSQANVHERSQSLSAQYVDGYWKIDPAMSEILGRYRPQPITLTRQVIDVLPRGLYRHNWEVMNALDRVSIWGSAGQSHILLHAYRFGGTGPFSKNDLKLLFSVAQVSAATISKHGMISHECNRSGLPTISNVVKAISDWNCNLSSREAEVCALLVLGKSGKQIAQEIGIAPNSVITYRRRAFTKLDIASRSDLVRKYSTSRASKMHC
jgi:DNA-binding CsgD family transcriptional regulator